MFSFGDLFQWDRFITTSIIRPFYWLAVVLSVLFGLWGLVSALNLLTANPLIAMVMAVASLVGIFIGIVFARIVAEFVLIVFRINEHLGAIRHRDEM